MSSFFRIVTVEGTPLDMGREYGQQTTDLIRELVDYSKRVYERVGYTRDDIERIREMHEDGIRRQSPELMEEIRGMAEGAGVSYEFLMDACLQRES